MICDLMIALNVCLGWLLCLCVCGFEINFGTKGFVGGGDRGKEDGGV